MIYKYVCGMLETYEKANLQSEATALWGLKQFIEVNFYR